MDTPTAQELAAYMGSQQVPSDALQECLDTAIECVETYTGTLAARQLRTGMCREAIFVIAKHLYGVRQNPSGQSAQFANGEYTPGPAGYLIPNRAATLIDSLRWDSPDGVGIG